MDWRYQTNNIRESISSYIARELQKYGYVPVERTGWLKFYQDSKTCRYLCFNTELPSKPGDAVAWGVWRIERIPRSRNGVYVFLLEIAGNNNVDQYGNQMLQLADDIHRLIDIYGIDLIDFSQPEHPVVDKGCIYLSSKIQDSIEKNLQIDDAKFIKDSMKKPESKLEIRYILINPDPNSVR